MAGSRSQSAEVFVALIIFVAITLLMTAFAFTLLASLAGFVVLCLSACVG